MTRPRLSILTICWNSVGTIERCVRSVLRNHVLPWEYLFVDGGSTDGTLEKLAELGQELEAAGVRFRLLPQQRREGEAGIPSAWNQGLAAAEGEWIALLNSDDWYETDAIERVTDCMAPSVELISAPVRLISPQGQETGILFPRRLWLLEFLMPLPHPGCFVSRRLYDRIGLYDTRYKLSADYDFIWRCRKGHVVVTRLSTPCVCMETGGAANRQRALARNETLTIARRHSAFPLLAWGAWGLRRMTGR